MISAFPPTSDALLPLGIADQTLPSQPGAAVSNWTISLAVQAGKPSWKTSSCCFWRSSLDDVLQGNTSQPTVQPCGLG